ncbi:MAG: hypothetical protein R3E66_11555 [bacterium]
MTPFRANCHGDATGGPVGKNIVGQEVHGRIREGNGGNNYVRLPSPALSQPLPSDSNEEIALIDAYVGGPGF